jgi:UPF0148 protein
MSGVDKDFIIKKSAELLRAGAKMLSSQCPVCGSPLFQLKTGEVVCPVHGKVIIIKKEEEVIQVSLDSALIKLEEKAMNRLASLISQIDELREKPSMNERNLLKTIKEWLEVIYASRKIRLFKESSSGKKE